jgi:hypothetical protein
MGDISIQKIDKEDIINNIPGGSQEFIEKKFLKIAIDHKESMVDKKIQKKKEKNEFQSQRIQNIKSIKKRNEEMDEKTEFALIQSQAIKGLTQQKFNFEGNMQNAGCFSCFEPYYNVKI